MSESRPLSYVLAGSVGTPLLPFTVSYDGEPYKVRNIHGRSVELEAKDGYKVTLRQESVLVDPAIIQWHPKASESLKDLSERESPEQPIAIKHSEKGSRIGQLEARALAAQGLKRCPKCGQNRPIKEFNTAGYCSCRFAKGKDPLSAAVALNVLPHSPPLGQKTCAECGEDKTFSQFPKRGEYVNRCFDCAPKPAPVSVNTGVNHASLIRPAGITGLLEKIRKLRQERDEARAERDQLIAALEEALS